MSTSKLSENLVPKSAERFRKFVEDNANIITRFNLEVNNDSLSITYRPRNVQTDFFAVFTIQCNSKNGWVVSLNNTEGKLDSRYVHNPHDLHDLINLALDAATKYRLRKIFEADLAGFKLHSYGGSFPVQAEGEVFGHPFYFRYRHGVASLCVGGEDVVLNPLYVSTIEHSEDSYAGILDDDEFVDLFLNLIKNLEPAQFLYRFEFEFTKDIPELKIKTTQRETHWCREKTPEAARESVLPEYLEIVLEYIGDEIAQEVKNSVIVHGPLNKDTRTYGSPLPIASTPQDKVAASAQRVQAAIRQAADQHSEEDVIVVDLEEIPAEGNW